MKKITLFATFICLLLFVSLVSFYDDGNSALIREVLSETNQFRKSNGLPEVTMRSELNSIAQQHSQNMASGKIGFGHTGFEQRNAQAKKAIQNLHSFAENVAYGATSAQQVVTMWKNSAGHRRNMLGKYQYIGIGIAKDKQGRIYYTEVFGGD